MSGSDLVPREPEKKHELALPRDLEEATKAFAKSSLSRNTLLCYASDWKLFCEWCERHARAHLPASPETVAAYLADAARSGSPWTTISRRLSAISQAHVLAGHESPRDEAIVRRVGRGIQRELGAAAKSPKKALMRVDLERVLSEMPNVTARDARDRALLLLGFACAFRRSELAALDMDDLEWVEDRGLLIRVRRSKTDQAGRGRFVGVPKDARRTIEALQGWTRERPGGEAPGPLFCGLTVVRGREVGKRLTPKAVGDVVIRALARVRLVEKIRRRRRPAGSKRAVRPYGAHSLRAGFVTQAREDGKALDEIMQTTGHQSVKVVMGYIRKVDVWKRNAASGVAL